MGLGRSTLMGLPSKNKINSMAYNFEELRKQINDSVSEHNQNQSLDGFLYNSFVIAAILCSSIASLLVYSYPTWAKILSLATAAFIGIDRALNWGARWIYHRQMRHEYLLILARINLVENINEQFTEEERKKYFMMIFDDLFALRKKESLIPGVSEIKVP
jgi:hypothetical protein